MDHAHPDTHSPPLQQQLSPPQAPATPQPPMSMPTQLPRVQTKHSGPEDLASLHDDADKDYSPLSPPQRRVVPGRTGTAGGGGTNGNSPPEMAWQA